MNWFDEFKQFFVKTLLEDLDNIDMSKHGVINTLTATDCSDDVGPESDNCFFTNVVFSKPYSFDS